MGFLERALNVVWGVGNLGFWAGAMAFLGSFSAASAPSAAAPHLQRRRLRSFSELRSQSFFPWVGLNGFTSALKVSLWPLLLDSQSELYLEEASQQKFSVGGSPERALETVCDTCFLGTIAEK